MRWPRATKLRRPARAAAQRVAPGSLVLVYHRVAAPARDPWSLCVPPAHFAEHAELLRGRVRPLASLCGAGRGRGAERGAIALTFDDGYADALHAALPLLERHALPATFFVATGAIDGGRSFWWDELAAILEAPSPLPPELALRVSGVTRRFEVDPPPHPRLRASLQLLLAGLESGERRAVLERLAKWAGAAAPRLDGERALTREELARLAASRLVEIGAHSVSHPSLPALAPLAQRGEILGARDFLARALGRRAGSFAYPHGAHSAATRELLRSAGFERACTTRPGLVRPRGDRLRLPRIEAPACDGEGFARFLHRLGFRT